MQQSPRTRALSPAGAGSMADPIRACGASVLQVCEHAGHEGTVTPQPSNPRPLPAVAPAPLADTLRACGASACCRMANMEGMEGMVHMLAT